MAELDTSGGGKHKGGKKRGKKMSTRVDMTPMVDLGFLLVTFFILTTTFSKPQTMEINLPVRDKNPQELKDAPAVKASQALTIICGENNKVFYYQGLPGPDADIKLSSYGKDGIRKVLLESAAAMPKMVVLIKCTNEANYKNMVDVLDEMNICNVKRYALVDVATVDLDLIKKL
jgi:biopolymer transport protein ExbD